MYSEVAALISSNDWRPEFLLQLFKDLRLLSSCADPSMQAALSSIHTLATRTIQVRFEFEISSHTATKVSLGCFHIIMSQ